MKSIVHWLRRDFRARDNTGLLRAGRDGDAVVALFVIDPRWFGVAEKMGPHQARFWLESLAELGKVLESRNIPLVIRTNPDPVAAMLQVAREAGAEAITYNKEYEPAQVAQDMRLEQEAKARGITVIACKDSAVFEEQEIVTGAGGVYSVFTPYKRAWLKRLEAQPVSVGGLPRKMPQQVKLRSERLPENPACQLDIVPGERGANAMLETFIERSLATYSQTRDFPANPHGTSRLSAHLNAGTISIRHVLAAAMAAKNKRNAASADVFISELAWREFYRMILFNYPETVSKPFQKNYAHVKWNNDAALFDAWTQGRTGYPIVDAAMRQLATTGFMHNRLRMIAAMFLTKNLDTHWVIGERFFMRSLVDYDQAANVGGWQWSASTGTDAAPYFRIINPELQSRRFDPEGEFIRQFVPELRKVPDKFLHAPHVMPPEIQREAACVIGRDYPAPIVDHATAKAGAIAKFRRR